MFWWRFKKFYKSNYKGKYFVIDVEEDDMFGYIGFITKRHALKEEFIKTHKENCDYYGIPCYLGDDKDMNRVYRDRE